MADKFCPRVQDFSLNNKNCASEEVQVVQVVLNDVLKDSQMINVNRSDPASSPPSSFTGAKNVNQTALMRL